MPEGSPFFFFEFEAWFYHIVSPSDVVHVSWEARGEHGSIGLRDGTRLSAPRTVCEACLAWILESRGIQPAATPTKAK